jgi:hypothetical protein
MKQTVALGGQRIHRRKTREGLASAILVLCIALLAGSCSNNGTGPAPTNGPYPLPNFQLTINVKDAVRRPVSSLRVCGGSLVNVAAQNQSSLNWGRLLVARLTAEDTLQARVLFRDSVYLVCAPFDNGNPQGELGYTSTSGSLEIDNVDRFAGLLQLPAQYLTGPILSAHSGSFLRLVLYSTIPFRMHLSNTTWR